MDTDVLCRACNKTNDIAVLVCECGQDLTRMASPARRAEVLAAREGGNVGASPTDNEEWADRPNNATMDGIVFDDLQRCCDKETLCILGSGDWEGKCRVCGKKLKVKLS